MAIKFDKQSFMKKVEVKEGRKYKMYMLDNIPHIGIGHNIVSRALADETLEFLGIEDESDLMHVELNDAQCDFLLEKDLDIAIADAIMVIGDETFDGLSPVRQEVLVDMSFNLGRPRFSKFKNMIQAVQIGDFTRAADEILDSAAARNPLTKTRYEELAKRMLSTPTPTGSETDPISILDTEFEKIVVEKLDEILAILREGKGL